VAAAGRPIHDLSDLTIAIYGRKPGEKVPLEFSRSGQKRTIQVSLKAHARLHPSR
jgi:S1-C subfamily serine protease